MHMHEANPITVHSLRRDVLVIIAYIYVGYDRPVGKQVCRQRRTRSYGYNTVHARDAHVCMSERNMYVQWVHDSLQIKLLWKDRRRHFLDYIVYMKRACSIEWLVTVSIKSCSRRFEHGYEGNNSPAIPHFCRLIYVYDSVDVSISW
jgi:hypothetical protein